MDAHLVSMEKPPLAKLDETNGHVHLFIDHATVQPMPAVSRFWGGILCFTRRCHTLIHLAPEGYYWFRYAI